MIISLLNDMAHNLTQSGVIKQMLNKQYPRLQQMLTDSYPTESMNAPQIAGVALAMYTQGGALFE